MFSSYLYDVGITDNTGRRNQRPNIILYDITPEIIRIQYFSL